MTALAALPIDHALALVLLVALVPLAVWALRSPGLRRALRPKGER